jgi:hypothetical protein
VVDTVAGAESCARDGAAAGELGSGPERPGFAASGEEVRDVATCAVEGAVGGAGGGASLLMSATKAKSSGTDAAGAGCAGGATDSSTRPVSVDAGGECVAALESAFARVVNSWGWVCARETRFSTEVGCGVWVGALAPEFSTTVSG